MNRNPKAQKYSWKKKISNEDRKKIVKSSNSFDTLASLGRWD